MNNLLETLEIYHDIPGPVFLDYSIILYKIAASYSHYGAVEVKIYLEESISHSAISNDKIRDELICTYDST